MRKNYNSLDHGVNMNFPDFLLNFFFIKMTTGDNILNKAVRCCFLVEGTCSFRAYSRALFVLCRPAQTYLCYRVLFAPNSSITSQQPVFDLGSRGSKQTALTTRHKLRNIYGHKTSSSRPIVTNFSANHESRL